MGLFDKLKTDGLEKSEDRLGGYQLFDSDAYLGNIKVAYLHTADSGAMAIALVLDFDGKEYNETIYVTNRNGENFFLNKDDNTKKVPLPGFTIINDLCMLTSEKPLSDQDTDTKMVNIYDPAERKAIPTEANVLIDLVGKTAYFGILKRTVNKTKKNETSGKYEETDDTREENALVKVFHDDTKLTLNEAMQASESGNMPESPAFFNSWVEKNKGKTIDARKKKDGGAKSGRPGGPPQAGNGAPKTNSLFNK